LLNSPSGLFLLPVAVTPNYGLGRPVSPVATVTMDQDTAWKLVTKRRSREAIRQQFPDIRITGDQSLGLHALGMVSVMA
jgi:hypothetical protein